MSGDLSCPFCGSADIEDVSPWAGQLITSQARCRACNTYFEAVRDDFRAGSRAHEEAPRTAIGEAIVSRPDEPPE